MNKIIDLFNKQAELTYIDQFMIGLVVIVMFLIVIGLAYLIVSWIKNK